MVSHNYVCIIIRYCTQRSTTLRAWVGFFGRSCWCCWIDWTYRFLYPLSHVALGARLWCAIMALRRQLLLNRLTPCAQNSVGWSTHYMMLLLLVCGHNFCVCLCIGKILIVCMWTRTPAAAGQQGEHPVTPRQTRRRCCYHVVSVCGTCTYNYVSPHDRKSRVPYTTQSRVSDGARSRKTVYNLALHFEYGCLHPNRLPPKRPHQ